jgi:hypothetical protein
LRRSAPRRPGKLHCCICELVLVHGRGICLRIWWADLHHPLNLGKSTFERKGARESAFWLVFTQFLLCLR